MTWIEMRVFERLNDFLPKKYRQKRFRMHVTGRDTVKDIIESLGIPHPEVDLITCGSVPVTFNTIISPGDTVCVYPRFRSLDMPSPLRLMPADWNDPPDFVADVHLGRLAVLLRLMGFDCRYSNHADDPELAVISARDNRILLTRDRQLLMRRIVSRGYLVRSDNPDRQIVEVIRYFELGDRMQPFTLCLSCSGGLEPVGRDAVADRLPPNVRAEQREYHQCNRCGKVFWKGTHYGPLMEKIRAVRRGALHRHCL